MRIKTIYANGCSFTAGSELEAAGHVPATEADRFNRNSPVRRFQIQNAWPARLASRPGVSEVVNDARGGGSNARVVRRTLWYLADRDRQGRPASDLLVCIGLTDAARHERFVEDGRPGPGSEDGWELLKPALTRRHHGANRGGLAANRAYYGALFSERQAATSYVEHVVLLQALCDREGVALYLHDAMESNADRLTGSLAPRTLGLIDASRHRSFTGRGPGTSFRMGASFEHWAIESLVPLGPGGHPLLEGHDGWAEILATEIEDSGLLR